jgi:hypothetical protein
VLAMTVLLAIQSRRMIRVHTREVVISTASRKAVTA